MTMLNTDPASRYLGKLPSTDPCFVYAVRELPYEIRELREEWLSDETFKRAFPDDYERALMEIIFDAGFYDEEMTDLTPEYCYMACNWGFIDRLIGPWTARRKFGERWREFRNDCGMTRGTRLMAHAFLGHVFLPARERTFYKFRAALSRFIEAGYIHRFEEEVPEFGPMAFFAPTHDLMEFLKQNA